VRLAGRSASFLQLTITCPFWSTEPGQNGERVLTCDLTSPEIAELGITVVRAIIPGFHPLVFGHALRARGGSRLWRVPQALGYPGITPATGDNPVPHPFP